MMLSAEREVASSTNEKDKFLLSQWIRRALDQVDLSTLTNTSSSTELSHPSQWPANIRHSLALCSDEYLISSLSVAHSLANQICEVEDNLKEGSSLPTPGIDWADMIQVHLSSDDVNNDVSKNVHLELRRQTS